MQWKTYPDKDISTLTHGSRRAVICPMVTEWRSLEWVAVVTIGLNATTYSGFAEKVDAQHWAEAQLV